jgi:hypothetical protein
MIHAMVLIDAHAQKKYHAHPKIVEIAQSHIQ